MSHVEGGGVPIGTQLNGIYEIEKRIAMGGMGEVYIGHVVQTGDKVAIKMILPEHANNELILDLFRKEASTLHNLYHEAIVRYYVFSVDPGLNRPYLAMEYAEGPALGDRVRTYPLSEAEMSVILPRIGGGLHAAHKAGIVHRDLSPDNIILIGGDVNRAKIIDFGIAKSGNSEGTLIGSGFAGKLKYVSPEQLGLGGGEVTAQSDIYSLGLVLAEAATGKPLDMGGSQVEVIEKRRTVPDLSSVPAYIRPLINWMLQPEPSDRPASMDVVANWTPSTATPSPGAPGAAPSAASEATQIAPGGFRPAAAAASIPTAAGRDAPEPVKGKRRRRGPLPFLSLLFSGTVVAGVIAAVVVMSQPDMKLPDGTDVPNGTGSGTTAGNGTGDAADSGGKPTNGAGGDGDDGGTGLLGLRDGNGDGGTGDVKPPADASATADGRSTDGDGDATIADATNTSPDPEPRTPPGTLLIPLKDGGDTGAGDAGLRLGDGGASDVTTGPGPETLAAGDTSGDGALTAPTGGDVPRLSGGDTPRLTAPDGSQGSTAGISGGDAPKAPTLGAPETPTLSNGGGDAGPSLTRAPVDDANGDPANDLTEPRVSRDGPGLLTPGGDTDLAGVPRTGGALTPGGSLAPTTPDSLDSTAGADDGGGLIPVPTDGATTPRLGGGGTPTLTVPGADDAGTPPTVAAGGATDTPGLSGPKVPSLTGGGDISRPSLTKTPVAAGEKDPASDLAEPTVTTSSPGSLSAPTATGDSTTLAADDKDDAFALPRTGVSGPSPSTPETPGGGTTELAAVAAPKNQPPTIRSRAPDTLSANQGQPMDMRLGEFFDEDGAVNLSLKIQGDVPNGLTIEMVQGGIARMHGTPTEYGNYNIKVAAIDSDGLISQSITVALSVERPLENRDVRDYVLAYEGGDCFLSRPLDLAQAKPLVEVFLSEASLPAVYKFDADFKQQNGVEANIRARLISADQCELVRVLAHVGGQALDNSLVIRMIKDQLVAGDTLAGKIQGGRGARLFLFDNLAAVTDLSSFVREQGGETGFSIPISGGQGPQILIAARPRDGSGIAPTASLNQLLAAAQQGQASLALGFFVLK